MLVNYTSPKPQICFTLFLSRIVEEFNSYLIWLIITLFSKYNNHSEYIPVVYFKDNKHRFVHSLSDILCFEIFYNILLIASLKNQDVFCIRVTIMFLEQKELQHLLNEI